ncbi:PDZ domain-containing protein [Streptomyces sp. NPDC006446]|uniref:PDZ domain-containing protein n=1 Tax=Streptomyces sp. NPDC006446 TaxID=3154301 RepID=UPI0033AEFE3F
MEQTALRPKPMPGHDPGSGSASGGGSASASGGGGCGGRPPGETRRPHAARRRGRRLMTLLFSLFVGSVLVLSGVGLGTVGATVIGMSRLADLRKQAGSDGQTRQTPGVSGLPRPGGTTTRSGSGSPIPSGRSERETGRAALGIEAVDAPGGGGALVVGVHVPGPGYTAGLVRGDVLVAVGGTGVSSAADLARAVADAQPGKAVTLDVRHANGDRRQLSALPGIVT